MGPVSVVVVDVVDDEPLEPVGAHNSVVGADQGFRAPVGAHNSVVGADQGFRAPSGDQESVRDSVHEDSASARIAAGQRPRPSFRHPQGRHLARRCGPHSLAFTRPRLRAIRRMTLRIDLPAKASEMHRCRSSVRLRSPLRSFAFTPGRARPSREGHSRNIDDQKTARNTVVLTAFACVHPRRSPLCSLAFTPPWPPSNCVQNHGCAPLLAWAGSLVQTCGTQIAPEGPNRTQANATPPKRRTATLHTAQTTPPRDSSGRSECWPKPKRTHLERQRERTHHTAHRAAPPPSATDERGPVSNSEAHPPDYSLKSYQTRAGSLRGGIVQGLRAGALVTLATLLLCARLAAEAPPKRAVRMDRRHQRPSRARLRSPSRKRRPSSQTTTMPATQTTTVPATPTTTATEATTMWWRLVRRCLSRRTLRPRWG